MLQAVYGGKTELSLPCLAQRNRDEVKQRWISGYSSNHWSNIVEKKRAVDWIVQNYPKNKLETLYGQAPTEGLLQAIALVLLPDCWSVNTNVEFGTG